VAAERVSERRGRGEAVVERHGQHALAGMARERPRRPLDAHTLDEPEQRLPGDRREHPVEMKRRKRGDPGGVGERQFIREMLADVIDDAVDPLLVLGRADDVVGPDIALSARRAPAKPGRSTHASRDDLHAESSRVTLDQPVGKHDRLSQRDPLGGDEAGHRVDHVVAGDARKPEPRPHRAGIDAWRHPAQEP
jgi:hypothetical protein